MLYQIQAIGQVGKIETQEIFAFGSFDLADACFDKMIAWNEAVVMFVEHEDGSENVLRVKGQ